MSQSFYFFVFICFIALTEGRQIQADEQADVVGCSTIKNTCTANEPEACCQDDIPCAPLQDSCTPFIPQPCCPIVCEYAVVKPCSLPCPSHQCVGLDVNVDVLYWELRTEGIPYAFDTILDTIVDVTSQDVLRLDPHLDVGVRVGFKYLLPSQDPWELDAQWAYLNSHTKNSATAPGGVHVLVPIWVNPADNPIVTNANAEFDFRINILDLDISRPLCLSPRFLIVPSAGIRGVWIDQELNVTYVGNTITIPIQSKNKINFWGYGMRFGFETKWRLCYGFSLFANSGLDILWSRSKLSQVETQTAARDRNRIKDKNIHTMTPMFEMFFGLEWERSCNFKWLHRANAHIGWEKQYFINATQFNQYTASALNSLSVHQIGGLGIGGLSAGVAVGF